MNVPGWRRSPAREALCLSAALALAAALAPGSALGDGPVSNTLSDASSLQCGGSIVGKGETKESVQEKCGKPTSVEGDGEVWVYDFGPGQFVYYLRFLDGSLSRIQSGGYGQPR